MSTQPEALRLADELEEAAGEYWRFQKSTGYGAAAELRRLHAENEALQNTKHYEAPPGFVLNPDYLVPELRAQRDALLEALKVAEPYLRHADVDYNVYVQCRAAIALVEGRVKAVEEGK